MVKSFIQSKVVHYIALYIGLGIGLIFLFGFLGLPKLPLQATIGLCLYYFVWGVVHHHFEDDLHIKIVLEYFLVAAIACLLLVTVVLRA
jgi:hypothetical protein